MIQPVLMTDFTIGFDTALNTIIGLVDKLDILSNVMNIYHLKQWAVIVETIEHYGLDYQLVLIYLIPEVENRY